MAQIPDNDRFHTIDVLVEWYIPVLLKRLDLNDDIDNYTEQAENIILALEEYRFRHPKDFNIFSKKVVKFDALNQILKLDPETLANPTLDVFTSRVIFFKLILLLPFALYNSLNRLPTNLVHYFIMRDKEINSKTVTTTIFVSTILVLIMFYGIQTFLVGYFFGNWWMSLFYIISLFVSSYLNSFNQRYNEIGYQQSIYKQLLNNPNHEFAVLYREIIYMMDEIFKDWINKNVD